MNSTWFYSHDGQAEGPFPTQEIKERIAQGRIRGDDLLWPEGGDPKGAIPASAVLELSSPQAGAEERSSPASSSLPSGAGPTSPPSDLVPSWLNDVQAMERREPQPESVTVTESPDWLEDLRLWVGLDLYTPTPLANSPAAIAGAPEPATHDQGLPDWLEGWALSETRPAAPAEVVSEAVENWLIDVELVEPSAPAEPSKPAKASRAPDKPAIPLVDVELVVPPAGKPAPPKKPIPMAQPLEPVPAKPARPVPKRQEALVEKTIQETGFDPATGRIVNPDKFQVWKKAGSTIFVRPGATNASIFEVFRKARTAIENWVDDEKNRLRILHAEIDEIKQTPSVQQILRLYAGYGKDMAEKMTKHLAFLVANRKSYYRTTGKFG